MKNLMDIVSDVVSGGVLDQVVDLIGSDKKSTSSAISKFAPAIIGGLINRGDSVSGAQSLIDIFKRNNYGENNLSGLGSILGNTERSASFLNDGMGMLDMIFGNKMGSVLDKLVSITGLGKASGSTLLKFLAPIIVNKLAGGVIKNNWVASKLMNYLTGQRAGISKLIPGMSSVLGFADTTSKKTTHVETRKTTTSDNGGGGNWWKWLIPVLLIGGLLWFLTRNGCGAKKTETVETTEKVTSHDDHAGHDHATHDHSAHSNDTHTSTETTTVVDYSKYKVADNGDIIGTDGYVVYKGGEYALDADGNVVDLNGKILIPAASLSSTFAEKVKGHLGKYAGTKLTLDANGNLVDAAGKIIVKKGSFVEKDGFYYDNNGNKIGRIWAAIVGAVSSAATATVDGMKSLFTSMFTKKPGAKTSYLLNDIEFNKENHRITNFSKAEVEGLAAALKSNKDSKIKVNVYTNDGKNGGENKKLSKIRAEVVQSMLTTLGVDKGQISFAGKGDSDAAKAAQDRVEITVSE